MASVLSRIQIIMEANTANYNNELRRARDNSSKTFKGIASAAGKMALGAGVALVGLGVSAMNTAGEFEAAMNGVRAVSGATGEDFTKLRDTARELGAATQYNAKEAANGMEELAKAGFNTAQILDSVPSVLSLASAGAIELAQSAGIVADVLGGMSLGAEHSARVADVLAKAAASSAVDVAGLGDSMTNVASVAQTMGQDLETTTALLGALGDKAITGGQAGTQLKGVMLNLRESKDDLAGLGIAVSDSSGNIRSMIDILKDLAVATKDLSPEDKIALYDDLVGKINITGLAALVDTADSGSLEALKEKLDNAKGSAKEMADIRMEGLKGSIKGLGSAWYDFKLELTEGGSMQFAANMITNMAEALRGFTKLLPDLVTKFKQFVENINLVEGLKAAFENLVSVFVAVGDAIAPVINWFKEHDKLSEALAISIGLVAAGFAIYAASVWVGAAAMTAFATVMAIATAPITGIVLALVAVVAAGVYLYQNWDTLTAKASEIWQGIKDSISGAIDGIISYFTDFISSTGDVFSSLGTVISEAWKGLTVIASDIFSALGDTIASAWDSIKAYAVEVFNSLPEPVHEMANNILSVFTGIKDGIQVAFSFIAGIVTGAIAIIKSAWASVTSVFTSVLSSIITSVSSTVSSAWASITGAFSKALEGIKKLFASASKVVSAAFEVIANVASSVLDSVKAGLSVLGKAFSSAFEGMKNIASNILKAIVTVVKANFEAIKAVAVAVLTSVAVVFNTGFNLIKNTVQTVMSAIKALISGDMQGVVAAFRTGLSNARNIVTTGINNIVTAFKTLGTRLIQVGSDAVQGFINGMKAKFSSAVKAVADFVAVIKDGFTKAKAFDIRSPSRYMIGVGRFVGEGFNIGLKSTISSIEGTADILVKAVKKSLDINDNSPFGSSIGDFLNKVKADQKAVSDMAEKSKNNPLAQSKKSATDSIVGEIESATEAMLSFGNETKRSKALYQMTFGSLKDAPNSFKNSLLVILEQTEQLEILVQQEKEAVEYFKMVEKDFISIIDTFRTEDDLRLDKLKEQLSTIKEMASVGSDYMSSSALDELSRELINSYSGLSEYTSIYGGQAVSEATKNLMLIGNAATKAMYEYEEQRESLLELQANASIADKEALEFALFKIEAEYSAKKTKLLLDESEAKKALQEEGKQTERAALDERMSYTGEAYGILSGLVKGFAGENSRVSKAMFAVQKAHTLATIFLKNKEALAIAWASAPFPNNLGAVAMAALKTGALASAAQAIMPSMSGQAHNGLANVPKEGTYLLDEGERVVRPSDNNKLTKFLDGKGSGTGNNITTNVTIASDGRADVQSNHTLGKDLGQAINAAVQKTLRTELRQGGMLAR